MRNKIAAILNLVEEDEKLKPLTNRRPIASLPFACRYRLIDFPFSSLYNAQAISAALFISGSGHSLYDHIRSGATWGLDSIAGGGVFTHSQVRLKTEKQETKKEKGEAEEENDPFYYEDHYNYVDRSEAEYVLIISSSMLANISLRSLIDFHEDTGSEITVAYKNNSRTEFREDSVYHQYLLDETDKEKVTGLKPLSDVSMDEEDIAVGMDIMLINKKRFLDFLHVARERSLYVNVKNFMKLALEADDEIKGFEYTGYLKAIEDISSYFKANMDMLDEEKFHQLFYQGDPVLTKAKNSAPTFYGATAKTRNSQFANDCQIHGTVENSLLFRKVNVANGAKVNHSIVMQDCIIEEGAEIDYVILDKHVYVKKGAKLKGTPENPIVIGKNEVVDAQGELVKG
jgi:glucose-1-phosphate adenylyltransferase